MVLNLTHRPFFMIENRQSPRFPKIWGCSSKRSTCATPCFFHQKQNPLVSLSSLSISGRRLLTEMWHRLCSASSPARSKVLCPIQQCSHETIDREMKTCTPVPCCVQCFLGSHYFWINLCWWQFHCQLLWWYYYGAFILLLFLCSQLFLFYFFLLVYLPYHEHIVYTGFLFFFFFLK